jgi:hypothetical protein
MPSFRFPADASFASLDRGEDQGYLAVAGGRHSREPRSVPRSPPKINGYIVARRVSGRGGATYEGGLGIGTSFRMGPTPLFQSRFAAPSAAHAHRTSLSALGHEAAPPGPHLDPPPDLDRYGWRWGLKHKLIAISRWHIALGLCSDTLRPALPNRVIVVEYVPRWPLLLEELHNPVVAALGGLFVMGGPFRSGAEKARGPSCN